MTRTRSEHTRSHWSAGWDADWDRVLTKFTIYQQEGKRQNKSRSWDSVAEQWGERSSSRTPKQNDTIIDGLFTIPTDRNTLSVGGQYQQNKLSGRTSDSAGKYINMKAYQYALFAENDFHITENVIFTTGLRMNEHEDYGTHWTPRAYLVYHLTPQWTLKGGVSTGYKTPDLKAIAEDYEYPTQRGAGVILGNPNLKPEKSTTEELSLLYNNERGISGTLTLFHTDFKDKITNYNTGNLNANGQYLWEYHNIGKSRIRGLEAGIIIPFLEKFKFSSNYTYTDSKVKSEAPTMGFAKGQPLTMTPKHKFDARLDYQITDKVNVYGRVEHTGKQVRATLRSGNNLTYRRGYTTGDIGGTYHVNDRMQISAAILNVGDKRSFPDDASGDDIEVTEDGRRFWMGITVNF